MTGRNEKAPVLEHQGNTGKGCWNTTSQINNSNQMQEEEKMMTPIVSRNPRNVEPFNAVIQAAGATVTPWHLVDGTLTVELDHGDEGGVHVLTPEVACALAAALQAVAVHQMEQAEAEAA